MESLLRRVLVVGGVTLLLLLYGCGSAATSAGQRSTGPGRLSGTIGGLAPMATPSTRTSVFTYGTSCGRAAEQLASGTDGDVGGARTTR